ncbi:MAG: VWA domain-containing protein [Clostridiales bacterium]|jgi:uncharacterized protein YegL|nr:VWA domain-containing protein [Clostridiales bacterium]
MENGFDFGSFGNFQSGANDGTVKLPVCLVLDNSGSMQDRTLGRMTKIDELNRIVIEFINYVRNDPKARILCDLCIVSFGGERPEIVQGYSPIDRVNYVPLRAQGRTPMGAGVQLAIDLLIKRRTWYRNEGVQHYKPILLLISDGVPTDKYEAAAFQLSGMVISKDIKVFPVGIGHDFDAEILADFSPQVKPKQLTDVQGFEKLFTLLSRSTSNPHDDSIDKWFNNETL